MKIPTSMKRLQISKIQSNIILTVSIAAAVIVFCMVSVNALLHQAAYQKKVIDARHTSLKQLKDNYNSANALVAQYKSFEESHPVNVIGGKNTTNPKANAPDGDNARIILNALPSKYDFPALVSSLSRILTSNRIGSPAISAVDQSETINANASNNPAVQPIPLTLSGYGTYNVIRGLVASLERSTRPYDVSAIYITGSQENMTVTISATTYFQPPTSLSSSKEEVR
jgi:hypothetical protein